MNTTLTPQRTAAIAWIGLGVIAMVTVLAIWIHESSGGKL